MVHKKMFMFVMSQIPFSSSMNMLYCYHFNRARIILFSMQSPLLNAVSVWHLEGQQIYFIIMNWQHPSMKGEERSSRGLFCGSRSQVCGGREGGVPVCWPRLRTCFLGLLCPSLPLLLLSLGLHSSPQEPFSSPLCPSGLVLPRGSATNNIIWLRYNR